MLKYTFDRFFPTPRLLADSSFGLDISDESVKFIELTFTSDGIRAGRHGEHIIPPGVMDSGKIKDTRQMEEVLRKLRTEEGIHSVRVSLPEQQVYLYQFQIGKDGLVSVREGIELSLEEHIPIPAEDAIFDYEIIGESTKNLDIQVAAIPKNVIDSYLTVFKNAEISVQSFELEAQAIFRSVVKRGDMNTYMIVDFGEKRTGIFIVSNGVVMFTSTLDIGGFTLNSMLQKSFNIDKVEAEKLKIEYGLQRNMENKEVFSVLLNSVSILRDEVAKHFVYWQTHKDEEGKTNPTIKKIILCGGDSNLIGLADYLSTSMKTPVERANVWINIENIEEQVPLMNFKRALSFAASIGLALGDFDRS
jgi:type IV pilus assembly protein PilM